MSKGIGSQQKVILEVISKMPNGGGYIQNVYREIKKVLYPEVQFIEPINYHELMEQCSSIEEYRLWQEVKEGEIKRLRDKLSNDPERRKQLNRIRVSVATSVKGLIQRGYIEKVKDSIYINTNAYTGGEH